MCAKKVKNRFSGKKNLRMADRTVQKQEDSQEEIELVEMPLAEMPIKELKGYQLRFASQSAT